MFKSVKHRIIALALTAVLILPLMFTSVSLAKTVEFEDEADAEAYESAQDNLADLNAQQKQLAKELSAAKSEKKSALAQKSIIQKQIVATDAEIATLNWVLADLNTRLTEKNAELAASELEYEEFYERYKSRIRATYEAGDLSYIEVILTSANFAELLTRIDFVADMMAYDKSLLDGMKDSISFIESTRVDIEDKISMQESLLLQLEDAKITQQEQVADLDRTVSTINNDIDDLESAEAEFLRLEEELNKEIEKLLDRQKKYVGGDFLWPLDPEYDYISSGYGYRNFDKSFHDAIDLPAPSGTPIYAANDGKIIMYNWVNTGGGNKIVIDHGSNITTTYCHLSKFVDGLGIGSEVKKGDVIGYVGTTGRSTGNHLHFRIGVDGGTVNPVDYVTPDGSEPAKKLEW